MIDYQDQTILLRQETRGGRVHCKVRWNEAQTSEGPLSSIGANGRPISEVEALEAANYEVLQSDAVFKRAFVNARTKGRMTVPQRAVSTHDGACRLLWRADHGHDSTPGVHLAGREH